ncbi:MAG: PilZ domain-containing protein [Deltaproteobacteria bacterium]|nr:PilZ domain-containing protein [Deltaproteobacteria bacterium]
MGTTGDATKRIDYRTYGRAFEAMIWSAGRLQDGRLVVSDLSRGGAFLECADPPELGASIELVIAMPAEQMFQARASVVHRQVEPSADAGRTIVGVGVRFVDLNADQERLLAAALAPASAPSQTERPDRKPPAPPPTEPPRAHRSPAFAMLHLERLASAGSRRTSVARDLVASAKQAIAKGLYLRAAADLTVAAEFAPEDAEIATLSAAIVEPVNQHRARRAWLQGLAFETAGEEEKAGRSFSEAASLCPQNCDYLLKAAIHAIRAGEFPHALDRLERASRARPRSAEIYALFSEVHLAMGNHPLALKAAETAAQLAPRDKDLKGKLKALRAVRPAAGRGAP